MKNKTILKNILTLSLMLGFLLMLPLALMGQNTVTVTKTVNPNFSTNSTGPAGVATGMGIPIVAGVDIPAGYVIVDVQVSVTWSKTLGTCAAPVAGAVDLSEVGFGIQSPLATRYFAASALSGPLFLTTNSWAGNTQVLGVTTSFNDGAASLLPAGLPVNGSFAPNGQSLSAAVPTDFLGDSPFGTWNLLAIDDASANAAVLCVQSYSLTITACPGVLIAGCRATATLALDSLGSVSPSFAAINLGSDTSCLLQSVTFAPAGPYSCANVGAPFNVTMTLTDQLGNTASCVSSVNVTDVTAPDVPECRAFPATADTVFLDATGVATYLANTAVTPSDACGISTVQITGSLGVFGPSVAFNCSNRGPNNLFVRVTDVNGNVRSMSGSSFQPSCRIRVVVFDTFPPTPACQNIALTLDASGNAVVTPGMINNGSSDVCTPSGILLYNLDGFPSVTYTCANVGVNTVTLNVIENTTAAQGGPNDASCTATVTITDVTPPVASCANLTVPLDATGNITVNASTVAAASTDNCAPLTYSFSTGATVSYTCANLGANPVAVTVTDPSGNSATCAASVSITDATAPNAICQNRTVVLDAAGNGAVTAVQVNNGSTDACGIVSTLINGAASISYTCANIGIQTVNFTVTDAAGNVGTCSADITIQDNILPVAACQNRTVVLSGVTGDVTVSAADINNGSSDICGIASLQINGLAVGTSQTYTCANVGANTAVLTVTDNNSNQSTCSATVTVQDNTLPVATCQNITVSLNAVTGTFDVAAADINNASSDICGIASLRINGLPIGTSQTYTCANIGANTAVLTVTDNNGNPNICNATVTVQDTTDPTALCQNRTVVLSGVTGDVTVSVADINNGSSDICGIASLQINGLAVGTSQTYTCANVGTNAAVLTVTDVNGNVSTCNSTITVQDNTLPVANCQNVTVALSGVTGTVAVAAADINNVSTDICGIASLQIDGLPVGTSQTYSCVDVGANPVFLTVTDNNGNQSTCNATVTVQDNTLPVATCQNITVVLSGVTGNATVAAAQINNGSSDICGIASLQINGLPIGTSQTYTCANVGTNTAILTATDNNGNPNTCNATVTVQDTTDPTALCQNINAVLGAAGTVSVAAAQINNGSSDICGIASIQINGLAVGTSQSYTCANVGPNAATLTITDVNGNVSTCPSTVTVQDTTRPTATCQNLTVFLDGAGNASVTAAQINNGSSDNCGIASLQINGLAVGTAQSYTCANVGPNTATLTVTDVNGLSQTCNATVTVQDTTLPVATCQNITVQLSAVGGTATVTAAQINNGSTDNCSIASLQINGLAVGTAQTYTCANIGPNTATLRVNDVNGLFQTCTATVTVLDTVHPVANCQNINAVLNAVGTVSVTAAQINNLSTDNCGIASIQINSLAVGTSQAYTCANVGPNTATLTVTDVNGNVSTCPATVTVQDTTRPTATCQNLTVFLDGAGNASVTAAQINNGSSDNCGIASLQINGLAVGTAQSYTCANVGPNTATLTVTDVNGLSQTCNATVTVQDTTRPVATCQNITVQLSAVGGTATVTAAQINNGSTDNCSIASLQINGLAVGTAQTYTCANIGPNTATLRVNDVNGLFQTCTATVTVLDTVRPVANCQNITVQLSGTGTVSVTAAQINNGSTDNCGIASLQINGLAVGTAQTYSCANIGTNAAILTVTDVNTNPNTCTATVTVLDTVRPVAICQNITVFLNGTGTVSVAAADINNLSTDNCGIASLQINSLAVGTSQAYSCANVGANTATLRVTDASGNFQTCNATVTVRDTVRPTVACQNVTLQLNASGFAVLTAAAINNGSSDACGIATLTVSQDTFRCTNIGNTNVRLRVTDVNGNRDSCIAVVTIQDTVRPVAICQNLTVYLNAVGTVSVTPAQINNGSTDNCGISGFLLNGVASVTYTCDSVGVRNATLRVNDVNSNFSTCQAQVTVRDSIRPVAVCQNRTVQLDASGNVTVPIAQINNGSTDNCGIASVLFNTGLATVSYTCANVGVNPIRIVVTDVNGNRDSCNASITVQDVTNPIAICNPSATVYVNALGIATVPATLIDNGSNDACGIDTMFVTPATLNCTNILAPAIVTLTVSDNNGLSSTCISQVTVLDTVAPTMLCANPTVYVNTSGTVSVSATQIDGGSSDACGIAQTLINGSTNQIYTCANLGPNNATLSATDIYGNTGTCNAIVTVVDTIRPVAHCRATFPIYLSGVTGNVTLTPLQVDSSSTDNCSVNTAAYQVNNAASVTYTCANTTTPQTVTLRVVDASGNFSTCTTSILVRDTVRPTAQCVPSITRNLSSVSPGTVTVNAISLNNASSDICAPPLTFLINGQPSFQYTCANLGPNTATLSVIDPSGNIGTCTATVIINDITPPTASCVPNLILNVDSVGQGIVNAASLNNASFDNCAVTTFLINGAASQLYTCANLGGNIATLTVRDASGLQATCTSVITVQDLRLPTPRCFTSPVNAYLSATGTVNVTGIRLDSASTDNCSITTRLINAATSVNYTCANIGLNNATLTVRDQSNNAASCVAVVFVQDTIVPLSNCQNITATLNASTGLAFVNATSINATSTDNCNITTYLINGQLRDTFDCTNIGANVVTLTVIDNSGNDAQCQATVTVVDNVAPIVSCTNRTFFLDAAGQVQVNPSNLATAIDACGVVNYTIDNLPSRIYGCSAATFTFADTIRAFDATGNMGSCIAQVTIRDSISPVASCQNITVQLDSAGSVIVLPSQINLNSSDNCSIVTYLINGQPSISFNCSNVGPNTVTLRVVDVSGNFSTCTAIVTVEDNIVPIARCRNIIVQLDANGNVTIPSINLNGSPGSFDACGPLTFLVNGQSSISYNCTNIGVNTVLLDVTDANGNTSTCSSNITVQDITPPNVVCQNFTLQLDASGNGTLTFANVVNIPASTDNCVNIFYTVNNAPSIPFNCSDVGLDTVMLIGQDPSGNRDTCFATVIVVDTVRPSINCNSIVVDLTAIGTDTLTLTQLGVSTSDACGIDTTIIFPNIITCANLGIVPVQVTTFDVNGNSQFCVSQVTVVLDGPTPSAVDSVLCEGQTLQLFTNPPATGFTYDYSWSGPDGFTSNINNPQVLDMQAINAGDYIVTITPQGVPGCAISDTVYIDVNVVLPPVLSVSAPVCLGDSATFVLANPSDYTGVNFTYEWFHNGTPVGSNNDTLTISPVSFADSGSYTMVITVDGCSDTTATPLNFVVNPLPAAFTPTFNTPCEGDGLVLFANPPTADPFTYSWAGPNSFVSASQDPVIAPAGLGDAGIYNITITDQNTCTATSAVTVTIKPTPVQPFIDYNDPLCLDDVLILTDTITRIGSLEFIWTNPNGVADTTTLPQYTVPNAVAGLYTLVVLENGCSSPSDDETIVYEPAPGAFDDAFSMAFRDSIFGMNVITNDAVRVGYSISIVDSTNNGTLTLNNQGTFDYRPGFIFHGLDTFIYEICDPVCPTTCDSAMVVIDVQLDQRCFIPNGLSPNSDGINDFLVVVCREDYPNMQIQIFSRWGNRVYQGDPNGWNGQFNGKDLPDAAYFYVLDYGDGSEPETGYIIINR